MAIHDLGHEAISLTGSQAGIVTDTVHTKAKIVDIRAQADPRGARPGPHRARRRLPGRLHRLRGDDARPRRLRHDRGRAGRRARRRRLRDLHRRRGRLLRRPADRRRARASCRAITLRGDARDGRHRREGDGAAVGRVRAQLRCDAATCAPPSRRAEGTWIGEEDEARAREGDHLRRHPRHLRGEGHGARACPTSPGSRRASSGRWPTPA